MGCHVTNLDANELLFEDHHEDGCEIINRGEYLSLFADDSIHIDREFAGILAGHLQRWSETGSFLEPVDKAEPAEEATAKFLGGLGEEIKALAERVAALEQAKEPEPQRWGVWGRWPDEQKCRWHTMTHKTSDAAHNWRTRFNDAEWTVYPYPADGGPPLELRKPQPYGLWNLAGEHWHTESPFESAGDAGRYATKTLYADWRNQWRVYPWPEDGGKPMELREPETPKLPELWGVWCTDADKWAGETSFAKSVYLFQSMGEAKKYCERVSNSIPRILPIEELIRD